MIKCYFWAPFRKQQRELIINWVKIGQHTSEQIRWPEHPRRKCSPGRIIRGTSVPSDDCAQYPSALWEFNTAFPFKMCFVPDKHCKSISCSSGQARSCAGKTPDMLPYGTPSMASNAERRRSTHEIACGADQNTQPALKEGRHHSLFCFLEFPCL